MIRFALIILMAPAISLWGADWYVAKDGNDAWSGKLPAPNAGKTDGPFASLVHARDAVHAARQTGAIGAVTVFVRDGLYELPAGLKFDAQDSGAADAPAVWAGVRSTKNRS